MTVRIEGKVARVSSDRELIINRGSEHGVEVGMVFRVKGTDVQVKDPDTGEILGEVSRIKVLVRVDEVAEKFCIARTFRTQRVNVGGVNDSLTGLNQIFQPPKWETRVETLRRDPAKGERISPGESVVAVGDLVETADDSDLDAAATTAWR
jgi:hypothetical protein